MRRRLMLLVALVGIALATLVSAQPAGAGDVDCTEVFVLDPTFCEDVR